MKILQILVFFLCLCGLGFSQSQKTFTLKGTVYDINKARIPGTDISIKSIDNKVFKTRTNDSGEYEITLPIGNYNVEFSQIGFKTLVVSGLSVNSTIVKNLDIVLDVGRCEDCNGALYGKRWDDLTLLSGYIYDSNGAVIHDAEITFSDFGNKTIKTITTNSQGWFNIAMPNGLYSILVKAKGFKDFKIDRYFATGTRKGLNLDVVLEVKSCDDSTIDCHSIIADPIKNN